MIRTDQRTSSATPGPSLWSRTRPWGTTLGVCVVPFVQTNGRCVRDTASRLALAASHAAPAPAAVAIVATSVQGNAIEGAAWQHRRTRGSARLVDDWYTERSSSRPFETRKPASGAGLR